MPQAYLVGLAAGLAMALLFLSASAGGMAGRIVLFFLAPLPGYLAGLGWGTMAAAIAALASGVLTAIFLGPKSGLVLVASQGLPLLVLCYLALLSRPANPAGAPGAAQPSGAPAALEWYPIGRILAAATVMAGALAALSIGMLGSDVGALKALMREFVDKVVAQQLIQLGAATPGEAELDAFAQMLLYALPAGTAVLWLGGFVLNLWLGGRITQVSGRLARPWPSLVTMRFPRGFGLGLSASLGLTLLSGYPGLLATAFVGAFLFAYVLMGLAIIHYGTVGKPARPFILWAVYLSLVVFNPWSGLVLALVAILEPLMPWKRPPTGPPPPAAAT